MSEPAVESKRFGLRSIGPASITASVVLGPGSILTSSKVGTEFGYSMIWVLASAAILMWSMTALSARLGVTLDGTLCDELTNRAGRPFAVLVGVSLFLIAACFQFSNNIGIVAAFEPFLPKESAVLATFSIGSRELKFGWPDVILFCINAGIITALLGFRHLYRPVEKCMKFLMGIMILGFAANLLLSRPSVMSIIEGFLPRLPEATGPESGETIKRLLPVLGMIGTTFSVGGAFFQSYLVRQKGWTLSDLRQGLIDSSIGIFVLGTVTMMIMVTAASVLHGKITGSELKSVADVAMQLEPLFGRGALILFSMGIFAGAISSFLVNAMIGGSIMSDGLGLGGKMDQLWPKVFTVLALLMGMTVGILVRASGQKPVNLIIFAQAMTVLGNPVLAGSMLWLATRPDLTGEKRVPLWLKILTTIGFLVVLVLALRTVFNLYTQLSAA